MCLPIRRIKSRYSFVIGECVSLGHSDTFLNSQTNSNAELQRHSKVQGTTWNKSIKDRVIAVFVVYWVTDCLLKNYNIINIQVIVGVAEWAIFIYYLLVKISNVIVMHIDKLDRHKTDTKYVMATTFDMCPKLL